MPKSTILVLLLFVSQSMVNAQCDANFSNGQNQGIHFFNDWSTGSNLSYFWDFGDGTTSTLQDVHKAYFNSGSYTVMHVVSNATCSDTMYRIVDVLDTNVCDAEFTVGWGPTQINGNEVEFYPPINSYILNYNWEFGDGNTSNQESPVHTYNSYNTYTACLTVTYNDGTNACADTSCHTFTLIDTTLSINQLQLEPKVSVSPNPFNDHIVVNLQEFSNVDNYRLYDSSGKTVSIGKVDSPEVTITTSELIDGIYMLEFYLKDGSIFQRTRCIKQ